MPGLFQPSPIDIVRIMIIELVDKMEQLDKKTQLPEKPYIEIYHISKSINQVKENLCGYLSNTVSTLPHHQAQTIKNELADLTKFLDGYLTSEKLDQFNTAELVDALIADENIDLEQPQLLEMAAHGPCTTMLAVHYELLDLVNNIPSHYHAAPAA